jgi:hypothetical protein
MNYKLFNMLPEEIIQKIYNTISPNTLIFLNKSLFIKNYKQYLTYTINNTKSYHNLRYNNISIDHYLKSLLRKDNDFILENVLKIYFKKFISMKKYVYNSLRFPTYYHCIMHISKFTYNSKKCDIVLKNILLLNGMNKNKYKKVKIVNNIWTN